MERRRGALPYFFVNGNVMAYQDSKMTTYYGIAATDKAPGSRELSVYIRELLPFVNGNFQAMEIENDISTSYNGQNYKSNLKTSNVVKCTYRDDNDTLAFPPDVRRGEEVLVYTFGSGTAFYWKSTGRDIGQRRTETKRLAISGIAIPNTELNDNNTYFIELDTRAKHHIKLSTSNADGEQFRYVLVIDADNNQVILSDNDNNQISIQSDIPRVSMRNADSSFVTLDKKNIVIGAIDDISIRSEKGSVNIIANKDCNVTVGNNINTKASKNINEQAGGNFSMTVNGNASISANGTGSFSSQQSMSISSGQNTSISAGGSLNLSFGSGGGYCKGNGEFAMRVGHFDISSA